MNPGELQGSLVERPHPESLMQISFFAQGLETGQGIRSDGLHGLNPFAGGMPHRFLAESFSNSSKVMFLYMVTSHG